MNSYRLSDEVISHIAQTLQLAILTGTDVVDNLRAIKLTSSTLLEGELVLDETYRENSDGNINRMLEEISKIQGEPQIENK